MTQFDARLYRARDYPRMPWRNGGGTTQEVACNPGGSTAGFEWRLSIADVGQDGGFSAFDGFQRIITVLEGAGIELTVDGRREPPLGPRRAYAFRGDAKVDCRLLDGPIRDFNLFYAPARWQARLQWLNASCVFHSSARAVLLLNASDAPLALAVDGARHELPSRHDCLHIETAGGLAEYRIEPAMASAALDACLIELLPVAA